MRILRTLVFTLTVALAFAATKRIAVATPEIPGADQKQPIALVGGTVHPVSGPDIENGVIIFANGKITSIGKDLALPAEVKTIDVQGKHVYPGLIEAHSNLGLVEINSVRATMDERETGTINPNVRAQAAFNPDSELIPVTRSNGILLSLVAPAGQLIAGRSAVMQLDGWTWEDITLRGDIGIHVDWPNMAPILDLAGSRPPKEQMETRDRLLQTLRDTFDNARAYQVARKAPGSGQLKDLRWEALVPVLEGKMPIIVSADELQQIQAAVAFAQHYEIKLIIYGGYDAPSCANLLKAHDVPIIVAGTYRLPLRRFEDYDAAYTVPERLRQAGVRYCIATSGRFGESLVRNLPYQAATAAAFGLPHDEALKSITLYAAQILGVADRVGSLDAGKDATLIVTDGDPLETPTQVLSAYVQGREVDLNDRQKRLWKKYEEKYRRLGIK